MVAKRIIPCLDICAGRTVKGRRFQGMVDVGDPVAQAALYSTQGADELVFLDISATDEERATTVSLVREVAACVSIPFTVGGGVRSIRDASRLLEAGADKVSVNSAAVYTPNLVRELAREFGTQCVVVAVDARVLSGDDEVMIRAGKEGTGRRTAEWVDQVCALGAGEILLTAIDNDGMQQGYALELIRTISSRVSVPVIASGGAGKREDFRQVFEIGQADAALASSVFHRGILTIGEVKEFLQDSGVEVRI
jgi:cyclase